MVCPRSLRRTRSHVPAREGTWVACVLELDRRTVGRSLVTAGPAAQHRAGVIPIATAIDTPATRDKQPCLACVRYCGTAHERGA